MTVTDIHTSVLHWNVGDIVWVGWICGGKQRQAYLLAKNGKRYVPPQPPDDSLVAYLMSDFGMKTAAARLLARRVPKGTEEERIRAVHRLYEKEGK